MSSVFTCKHDDFDVWFGWAKGWSNISTESSRLQAKGLAADLMNPGPKGGSLGSGAAWVDFFVWCQTT
ncbi:hypothetical protein BDZ90DRAFT_262731 [Jaminaea rosea]|uniref:Uncharacterized protein n=1 Tax=Jaminaea rosea TaxID=1569628 RepID=A0A316UI30_9BASI|nr:hypothetical protein BDZ90DRAFT_262731 [Jaminaea rosea]PWN24869.1 hypothetical protein BDZ90DRAFT_262731 [Jaminaea rosea]